MLPSRYFCGDYELGFPRGHVGALGMGWDSASEIHRRVLYVSMCFNVRPAPGGRCMQGSRRTWCSKVLWEVLKGLGNSCLFALLSLSSTISLLDLKLHQSFTPQIHPHNFPRTLHHNVLAPYVAYQTQQPTPSFLSLSLPLSPIPAFSSSPPPPYSSQSSKFGFTPNWPMVSRSPVRHHSHSIVLSCLRSILRGHVRGARS